MWTEVICSTGGNQHSVGLTHIGFVHLAKWPWGLWAESWGNLRGQNESVWWEGDTEKQRAGPHKARNYMWRLKATLWDTLPVRSSVKHHETSEKHQGALGPEKWWPATTLNRFYLQTLSCLWLPAEDFCFAALAYPGVLVPGNALTLFLAYTVKFHFVSETSSSPSLCCWAFAETTQFHRIITSAV